MVDESIELRASAGSGRGTKECHLVWAWWHFSDVTAGLRNVCCWGKSGSRGCVARLPSLTLSGHQVAAPGGGCSQVLLGIEPADSGTAPFTGTPSPLIGAVLFISDVVKHAEWNTRLSESVDSRWHSRRSNKRGNIHEESHFRCGFWRCATRGRQLRKRTRNWNGLKFERRLNQPMLGRG